MVTVAGTLVAPSFSYQNPGSTTIYQPDFEALVATSTRIVLAAGVESASQMTGRAAAAVAAHLRQELTLFPSHHAGFLGGEYGQQGEQPVAGVGVGIAGLQSRFQGEAERLDLGSYATLTWIFLIGLTLIRLTMLGTKELSGDEAHYWDWSRRLALGYYDTNARRSVYTNARGHYLGRATAVLSLARSF